jgi:hypothetical protein
MDRMNLRYLFFRICKRLMPLRLSDFLLRRNIGIAVSMGTTDPATVVREYERELEGIGHRLGETVVMEIGYGGSFGTAVEFLRSGVRHVYLYDALVEPHSRTNRDLVPLSEGILSLRDGEPYPDPERITVLPRDPAQWAFPKIPVDIILSRAVLEHVRDVSSLLGNLGLHPPLSKSIHAHFIDMRDHYFKYPYQMLMYDEGFWQALLCPAEYLNRLRLNKYLHMFRDHFGYCKYRITDSDPACFSRLKRRIKPCFLSGDDVLDAAQRAWVIAW